MHLGSEWLRAGKLQWDDEQLAAYSSRLLLPIEHNYGLDTRATTRGRPLRGDTPTMRARAHTACALCAYVRACAGAIS